jgi:hypothetical protein
MVFSEEDIQVIDDALAVEEQRQALAQLKSAIWRYG